MRPLNFMFWNGGRPFNFPEAKAFAKAQPRLPAPALLREGAIIEYWWGDQIRDRGRIVLPA